MSGARVSPGAGHRTSAAVFALLVGLLLLTLSPPCPHVDGPGRALTTSAESTLASAPEHTGAGVSCTAGSGALRAAARTADNVRSDDGGTSGLVGHARSGVVRPAACPGLLSAATAQIAQPHGWSLLILLETARV